MGLNRMSKSIFQVGAADIDIEKIMSEIRASVAAKMEAGFYRDPRVARAERTNLANLRDDDSFVRFYLDCLRDSAFVDIGDFEIRERRRAGALLIVLKKIIWKLLKFYTYRLWSQQNQINGLLVTAIEGVDQKYRNRLGNIERRLAAIEGARDGNESCQQPQA